MAYSWDKPEEHHLFIKQLGIFSSGDWYCGDAIAGLNHVPWDVVFPRAHKERPDPETIFVFRITGASEAAGTARLQREGQVTADQLVQNNVRMKKPWTSIRCNAFLRDGMPLPPSVFFVFQCKEDATLFKMFAEFEKMHHYEPVIPK